MFAANCWRLFLCHTFSRAAHMAPVRRSPLAEISEKSLLQFVSTHLNKFIKQTFVGNV